MRPKGRLLHRPVSPAATANLAVPPAHPGGSLLSAPHWITGLAALALLAGHAALAVAQDSSGVILGSQPVPLTEGTVGWLRVRPPDGIAVAGGEAAGEPIHFEPSAEGEYRGIVGVPVDAGDSLRVAVFLMREPRIDTVFGTIPIRHADYARETITVAPAFAKPDKVAAARIERENARSRQVSLASRDQPRRWQGPFQVPRSSRITSEFGAARVYNGEVKSRHTGTDFAGAVGAPVNAAGRGVVAMVVDFYLAGRAVYIDHGEGLVTAYFHLSRSDVAPGDTVLAGQRIGGVGQSGRVTGPHLHWVARYGRVAVDPMSLLDLEKGVADSLTKDSLPQSLRSGQAP